VRKVLEALGLSAAREELQQVQQAYEKEPELAHAPRAAG
jgi:hypothetical protein